MSNQDDSLSTQDDSERLRTWLTEHVASYVELTPEQIAPDVPLADYGLDSVFAFTVSGDIEDHLGMPVDPVIMWDHPTINALVAVLLQQLSSTTSSTT